MVDPELGRSASGTDAKLLAKNENLVCGFHATGCLIRWSFVDYFSKPARVFSLREGEGQMVRLSKIPVSVACSVAMLVAQVPPGFAQNAVSTPAQPAAFGPAQDVTPGPAILDAFKAFPKGGDQLSKRIEDLIVGDPKLAPGLAKYMQTAPDLTKEQKQAAFRGLALALNRLGIKAAELPLAKEPPPPVAPAYFDAGPILALAALGVFACVLACQQGEGPAAPVSP